MGKFYVDTLYENESFAFVAYAWIIQIYSMRDEWIISIYNAIIGL